MKNPTAAAVFVAACGLAFAGGIRVPNRRPPIYPVVSVPPDDPAGGVSDLPTEEDATDADCDGYIAGIDCNDDDARVNLQAAETANGLDDNCDGVVDEGVDTTIDWPRASLVAAIWPDPADPTTDEQISTETQPRLVRTGDGFIAAWVDLRHRLRVARFGEDAVLAAPPAVVRQSVSNLDVAWTGTRLGIVYEDGRVPAAPAVRLLVMDPDGVVETDVVVAAVGREPKVAWGQDRFGIVWNTAAEMNSLRFQRFGRKGDALSREETLAYSGQRPAIAFNGTLVRRIQEGSYDSHEGTFGIAYEANYGLVPSGDVLLAAFPRTPERALPIGPVRVNQQDDAFDPAGSAPAISGNAAGFLVAWHFRADDADGVKSRFFSQKTLTPVSEFVVGPTAARNARVGWTGGEFAMVHEGSTGRNPDASDVFVRRIDASGNPHVEAPAGSWSPLNLRGRVRGTASAHPDVAPTGAALGMVWVERDQALGASGGRLWFASVAHK